MSSALLIACNDSGSSSSSSGNGDNGNGNGDNGNGDNDNGQLTVNCEANLDLADNNDGLSREGHSGLSFFAVQDRVCALDSEQGTVFEVARSDNGEDVQQMDTHFSTDASGEMTIEGVVYAMDEHLWWADADASAGGVTPRQISSESRGEDVDSLRVEPDYQNSDNALVVYRLDTEFWYAVPVDAATSQDPAALELPDDGAVSVIAVRDEDGAIEGLILPQGDPSEFTMVFRDIDALDDEGTELDDLSDNLQVLKVGRLDSGDLLIQTRAGYVRAFDREEQELSDPVAIDALDDGVVNLVVTTRYANDGENVYIADHDSDGARLTRLSIDSGEPDIEILRSDIEDAEDFPKFVTTTDDHIVWAYSIEDSDDQIIEVVESIEKADTDQVADYSLPENLVIRDGIGSIGEPWVHTSGNKVFFNASSRSFPDPEGETFRAYWLEPDADPDALNYREDQNWRLALSDPTIHPAVGLARQERSEILVVARDEDVSDSSEEDFATAVPASEPDADGVELGKYGADGGPIGPFLLSSADYGFGPGRLAMRSMTGGENTLYWLDVRHEDSMKPILRNEEGQAHRLQPGF
ncbi:MAG: hypothetical protein LAT62_03290 [Natronospirillum sp.]|uniref:hypothetical protein n=1 Tax=Natronospirillum sp. TaxID=2812955 RepID=UPI0025D9C60D|nr:hypothetical protein [Natronospirillum sp.]MCH8550934.1 hypothetical protein [Natronospirillum sp.]